MTASSSVNAAEAALAKQALAYPETHEDNPWAHRAFKVRKKTFLFTNLANGILGLSVKLRHSLDSALALPFTEPTGHGLGKSGWVSARFERGDEVPVTLLKTWVEESYRLIAPKRLVAQLDGDHVGAGARKALKRTSKRKPR